jgi:hypothetical protein
MIHEAAVLLRQRLIGRFIVQFSLGDYWTFDLDNRDCLLAQDVASDEEPAVNALLATADPPVLDGADSARIAKAVLVCRNMRRSIQFVSIDSEGTLKLTFEGEHNLRFTTDTDVVDWQWCLNDSGNIPYVGPFIVACFWRGTVDVGQMR